MTKLGTQPAPRDVSPTAMVSNKLCKTYGKFVEKLSFEIQPREFGSPGKAKHLKTCVGPKKGRQKHNTLIIRLVKLRNGDSGPVGTSRKSSMIIASIILSCRLIFRHELNIVPFDNGIN